MQLEATILDEGIARGTACATDLDGLREAIQNADSRLRQLAARFQPLTPALTNVRPDDLLENVKWMAEQGGYLHENDPWTVEAGGGALQADLDLVSDAVVEILKNASIGRKNGGRISVHSTFVGDEFRIGVKEARSVAPIRVEEWGSIPFAVTSEAPDGLGLHFAARVVLTHHGRIERAYDAERRSLETAIYLPLKKESRLPVSA